MIINAIDILTKSVIVSAIGVGVAVLMRRSSAATRHFVLLLTLIGAVTIPFLASVAPRWEVPFMTKTVVKTAAVADMAPTAPVPSESHHFPTTVIVWAVVSAVLALRLVVRVGRLSLLERKLSMASDPKLQSLVVDVCRKSGRRVLLLEGVPGQSPMTWGHFRPVVLLPQDASTWPEERLLAVTIHELAHIERGDWVASLFAQIACVVCWFNPFVWVIAKRMELES
jgi:hypothetical protein